MTSISALVAEAIVDICDEAKVTVRHRAADMCYFKYPTALKRRGATTFVVTEATARTACSWRVVAWLSGSPGRQCDVVAPR